MSVPDLNQASFGAHISIPLGIFIGLLASFVQSLGLTMQRKSHVLNQNLPEHYQRVEHRRPLWLLGFSIFLSSNLIGSLVQIASLPVVILAPLGAVSLLWNAFFAHFILGDVFSIWMVLGTVLIAGGAVLIAIFGIVPEPTHSLDDLLRLFRRPAFIIYFSLLGLFVLSCLILTHFGEFTWSRLVSKVLSPEPLPNGTDVCTTLALDNDGTGDAIVTETTALLNGSKDRERSSTSSLDIYSPLHTNRRPLMLAISYASCSGIISGMCLIFAKSGVELLLLTLAGQNQFSRWESWVLGSGLVTLAPLQLWYLHKALKLANPTLVCPSAFCFYNLSSIVNGLVYFNQLQLIKPLHLWLVALGIAILLAGVWVVSIQSGGGAVDVGTWNDEESDAEVIDECEEIESDMDTREHQRPSQNVAPTLFGPVPLVFETRSESHLQHRSATTDVSSNTGKGAKHLSGHRPSSYVTQPTLQRSTVATESLRFGRLQHQRTASYPSNSFSSPIDTIPTFGTGLQIGLSPISPGFMIVPRERKQRHSVLGYDGGEDQIDEGEMGDRRRRLSEGDIRRTVPQIDDIGGLAGPSTAAERDTREIQVNGGQRRSRIQWKWLRHIFARRK